VCVRTAHVSHATNECFDNLISLRAARAAAVYLISVGVRAPAKRLPRGAHHKLTLLFARTCV